MPKDFLLLLKKDGFGKSKHFDVQILYCQNIVHNFLSFSSSQSRYFATSMITYVLIVCSVLDRYVCLVLMLL